MSFRKIFQKKFCIKKFKFFQKTVLLENEENNNNKI